MFSDCELRSIICILYIIPYIISERHYNVNDVALVVALWFLRAETPTQTVAESLSLLPLIKFGSNYSSWIIPLTEYNIIPLLICCGCLCY